MFMMKQINIKMSSGVPQCFDCKKYHFVGRSDGRMGRGQLQTETSWLSTCHGVAFQPAATDSCRLVHRLK